MTLFSKAISALKASKFVSSLRTPITGIPNIFRTGESFGTLAYTLLAIPVVYTFMTNVASIGEIAGTSMIPTLVPGKDVVLLRYLFYTPKRGDVVVLKDPRKPTGKLIKRLVGLPGDILHIPSGEFQIPDGFFWVEGDNSEFSIDCREYGPVRITIPEFEVT